MKQLDCHVHFADYRLTEGYLNMADALGYSGFNVVCTPHPTKLTLVPEALYLKSKRPDSVYVLGGLDIGGLFSHPQSVGAYFASCVDTLKAMGCDGIKMIEGKPDMKRNLRYPPFDAEVLDPYWAKVEAEGMPVLFHLNDPEEYWDAKRIPPEARAMGWYYGEGGFPNNEDQYREVKNVLDRHPNLKIIFAHFLFFSADLPRMASWLDQYPNIGIDLTPGIEMYRNLSKDADATKAFFEKYQDRIYFGTDIGVGEMFDTLNAVNIARNRERVDVVKRFLMDSEPHTLQAESFPTACGQTYIGLGLDETVSQKIMANNFTKLVGDRPRAINRGAIIGECTRLLEVMKHIPPFVPDQPIDNSAIKAVKAYFERGV